MAGSVVSTSLKPFLEAIRQSSHCDPATSPIRAQRRRWRWRQGARGQGDTSPAWQDLLVIGRGGERNIATLPIFSHNQHQVIDSRVRRVQCHWSRRRGKLLVTWDLGLGLSQTPWYEVWFINVALSPIGDICFGSTGFDTIYLTIFAIYYKILIPGHYDLKQLRTQLYHFEICFEWLELFPNSCLVKMSSISIC